MNVLAWHEAWGAVAADAIRHAVRALPPLPPGPVLDVGCGLGVAWDALAGLGRPVVALDADATVVEAARARAGQFGVRLVQGDVTEWVRDEGGTFALVWAGDVLWPNYFSRPASVVTQLAAALCPGGRIATFPGNWFGSRFLWGHPDLERRVQQASARRWGVPADGTDALHECVTGWLRAAGGRHLACGMHPLVAHEGHATWAACRHYLQVGVWPDYLAAARAHGCAEDVEALLALTTPARPGYLPDAPGYLAYQPMLVASASW